MNGLSIIISLVLIITGTIFVIGTIKLSKKKW